MDPGWPENPSGKLVCILCKSAMPFNNRNPERFFRHLLADHGTFFNLNLLLEMSLIQPHSLREEESSNIGNTQYGNELKNSIGVFKLNSSTTEDPQVHADEIKTMTSLVHNPRVENSLEHCQPVNPVAQLLSSNNQLDHQSSSSASNSQNVQSKANPAEMLSPADDWCSQRQPSKTGIEPSYKHEAQYLPPTYIPYESDINTFLIPPTNPTNPSDTLFTVSIPTDFSNLDPISFVKQKAKRKVTRQEVVNKNNQPVIHLPDNPNRHLVPEDLQMLICSQNPNRGIKFTYSQRMNTQMMVDDYVLKKKKGPYLSKGGRVVNWKCINDNCRYTVVTWEGQIQDTIREHNHLSQPELFFKKQARFKIKENIVQEEIDNPNPVANVVMDVVTETSPEMRNKIGSIDALKQAARRYNRKIHRDSQPAVQPVVYHMEFQSEKLTLDPMDAEPPVTLITNMDSQRTVQPVTSHMLLDHDAGETDIVSFIQSGNYEVVGEFPADFQFSMDLPGQVGHYTEVFTDGLETEELVNTEEVEVPRCSEQVTLEEIADLGDTPEQVMVKNVQVTSTEKLIDNNNDLSGNQDQDDLVQNIHIVSNEKLVDNDLSGNHLDDVQELLEPSPPTRENPLVGEL